MTTTRGGGRRAALLVAACLLWSAPAARAETAASGPGLSLAQAVEIALRQNHNLLLAREQLARVDGQIQEVGSVIYPQVGLSADAFRAYDESIRDSAFGALAAPEAVNRYGVRASLRQLLFSWGKASTAIAIAQDGQRLTREDLDTAVRGVTLQVHEAFYRLLLAQRLVDVAEERQAQRRRQLEVAEKRLAAGVVNEFEVLRAEVDLANAAPPAIRAKNQVRQAVSQLNNLLARDQNTPLETSEELRYQPLEGLTLALVVERAVTQRPELQSLRVAREIAEKAVRIAQAENKPQVNLLAEYGFAADQLSNLGLDREVWSAGVALTWPLFDGGRTRGQVAQATSEVRQAALANAQLEESITLEAKAALDDLAEARQIIDAASLNTEQAQKALELAEAAYRYGVATALDVTNTELSLTVARTDHARALHDYLVARARVLSVMNEL